MGLDIKDEVLKELYRVNLCTYYILPLIRLNRGSFVFPDNFVDSFINGERTSIVVHVREIYDIIEELQRHPKYIGIYTDAEQRRFIRYKIPVVFADDVDLFCDGKFSRMSDKAKKMIIRYSGLPYKYPVVNGTISDLRLQALDRARPLRDMWQYHLDLNHSINEEMDLLDKPGPTSYIDTTQLRLIH